MPMKTTADDPPSMNMIPMIDIMFNLIIFFLVTTSFAAVERDIALRVPEVVDRGALTAAPRPRVVNVSRNGTITMDDSPMTLDDLTRRLRQARAQYSGLKVLVRGDGRGQFQRVAEVLNACKQAGINELGISVRVIPPHDTP
jgi:biopolymer transport protein ExbD